MCETGNPGRRKAGKLSALRAEVKPVAPWRVKALSVLADYRLAVTFQDGTRGVVDLSSVTTSRTPGVFAALASRGEFEKAYLELGVVTWPCGADLDPAWMYEWVREEGTWCVPL